MIECLSVRSDTPGSHVHNLASQMRAGTLGAVVIEGILAPKTCSDIIKRLLDESEPAGEPLPNYQTYGEVLLMASALDAYREKGQTLADTLACFDIETKLLKGLQVFGGDSPVSPFVTNEPYPLYTVRALQVNGEIPVHSERADWPLMTEHRGHLDLGQQFSFYIPLQLPAAGGELVLYEQRPEAAISELSSAEVDALLRPGGAETVRVEPGDLLIFDAGRYNHRVTEVTVGPPRWTLGGFLAFGKHGLAAWS